MVAQASGLCSPANTGNNNTFNFSCGIGKEQGERLLVLVNRVISKELDIQRVLDEIDARIPKYRGTLIPASDPDPMPWCGELGLPKLLIGTNGFVGAGGTVLIVGEHDKIAYKLVRSGIAIDADLSADDGRIIARIQDNKFVVNPNNTFDVHGDDSTLIVNNDRGVEVLNVRFANPKTIRLNGRFYPRPGASVELTDTGILLNGVIGGDGMFPGGMYLGFLARGNCIQGSGRPMIFR
jgi:hypothetical protein